MGTFTPTSSSDPCVHTKESCCSFRVVGNDEDINIQHICSGSQEQSIHMSSWLLHVVQILLRGIHKLHQICGGIGILKKSSDPVNCHLPAKMSFEWDILQMQIIVSYT